MTTDYFPLVKGAVREYATEDALGKGALKTEVMDVSMAAGKTEAKCRRTIQRQGKPATVSEYTVTRDASGVRSGADIEFVLPLKVGAEWTRSPRRFWIEALDGAVETPAGKFKNCLRVAYLIAGGDGGSGERHYAPGVGLVKVVDNDEADPFTQQLIGKSG